jgi:hypothetical protein
LELREGPVRTAGAFSAKVGPAFAVRKRDNLNTLEPAFRFIRNVRCSNGGSRSKFLPAIALPRPCASLPGKHSPPCLSNDVGATSIKVDPRKQLRAPAFSAIKLQKKNLGAKVSNILEGEMIAAGHAPVRHGKPLPAFAMVLAAAATAAFLWTFALPVIGLLVFVSKFFAG